MPIEIEDVIERAFQPAFSIALEQTLPLAKKLEDKIDQGSEKFIHEGIRWEKRKPGFKK
jgi:hypothetical protein